MPHAPQLGLAWLHAFASPSHRRLDCGNRRLSLRLHCAAGVLRGQWRKPRRLCDRWGRDGRSRQRRGGRRHHRCSGPALLRCSVNKSNIRLIDTARPPAGGFGGGQLSFHSRTSSTSPTTRHGSSPGRPNPRASPSTRSIRKRRQPAQHHRRSDQRANLRGATDGRRNPGARERDGTEPGTPRGASDRRRHVRRHRAPAHRAGGSERGVPARDEGPASQLRPHR